MPSAAETIESGSRMSMLGAATAKEARRTEAIRVNFIVMVCGTGMEVKWRLCAC